MAEYKPPPIVQCGWCPVILANDWAVVAFHFVNDHGLRDGSQSVRYIQGTDWDMAELDVTRRSA
jgi:hypothetical protein